MKKRFAGGLVVSALLFLMAYAFAGIEPKSVKQEQYDLPFEDAKLIDTKVEAKTGVKIEVYTIPAKE